MGKERTKEMLFWTKEEYMKFIEAVADKPISFYAFEIYIGVECVWESC